MVSTRRWFETPLLIASLLSSVSFGAVLFVALPYLTGDLGGTSWQVGLVGALYPCCYASAMLAGRRILDRFRPRSIAVVGNLLLVLATLAMGAADSVAVLCVASAICGAATSWHWPPVMGLISTGCEGAALNRRLGRFNAAWSTGLVVGPAIGGWLYDIHAVLPFAVGASMHVICAILIWSTRVERAEQGTSSSYPADDDGPQPGQELANPQTPVYRSMARVALVCSFLVVGVLRNQLPVLAENELGIGASRFGPIGTVFSIAHTAGFALLGITAAWHFRERLLWIVQAGLGLSLLIVYCAKSDVALFACSILAGLGISFLYASHLFYGVSGGRRRARLMSIHETLLSIGFLFGAFGGGMVAEIAGLRSPYVVFCAVLLLGVVVEMVIFTGRGAGRIANNKYRMIARFRYYMTRAR